MTESTNRLTQLAAPCGNDPHYRRAGDFLYGFGLSPRRADDSIAGASADAAGTMRLDIRAQTRAVIEKLETVLVIKAVAYRPDEAGK